MDAPRSTERNGRLAPLAQAGLAALVAGSLLTFSTVAFRTAFDGSSETRAVTVSSPRTAAAEPVVLPTPPRSVGDPRVAVVEANKGESAQVLGIQIKRRPSDTRRTREPRREAVSRPARSITRRPTTVADDAHRPSHGKGHEKARGKGHHKDHDHDHERSNGRAKGKKH